MLSAAVTMYVPKKGVESTKCVLLSTISAITSCELYVNKYDNQDATTSTQLCGNCASEHKVSSNGGCVKIENCETFSTSMVSSCVKCRPGYAFVLGYEKLYNEIDYQTCVSIANKPNLTYCKVAQLNQTGDLYKCAACLDGFLLNYDLVCVANKVDKCTTFAGNSPLIFPQNVYYEILQGQAQLGQGLGGCKQCDAATPPLLLQVVSAPVCVSVTSPWGSYTPTVYPANCA